VVTVVAIYWHPVTFGRNTYLDYFDDAMREFWLRLPSDAYAALDLRGLHNLFEYFGKWAAAKKGKEADFFFVLSARWLATLRSEGSHLKDKEAEGRAAVKAEVAALRVHRDVQFALADHHAPKTLVRETGLNILRPAE